MSEPPVLLGRDGGVATITLNRPRKLNAIDDEMAAALLDALRAAAADSQARAVVLRGAGKAFMAGGDLACFAVDAPRAAHRLVGAFHAAIRVLAAMDKPVLASVHGITAGGGMSLAMACDMVVAAASTRLLFAYNAIATVHDGGLSWRLPRLVGARKAAEIALLGDSIESAEALRLGLVNRVVADDGLAAETAALAARLAAAPAAAVARTKDLLRRSWDADFDSQLDAEQAGFEASAATPEFQRRIGEFLDR